MSKDLLDGFFERDLSDEELLALKGRLASDDEALRFAQKALAFHQALEAGSAQRSLAAGSFLDKTAALLGQWLVARPLAFATSLVFCIVLGASAYRSWRAPVVSIVTPAQWAMPPAPAGLQAQRRAPAWVQAAPAPQQGKQLVIHLTLPEAASVETLVRDAKGVLVCSLGTLAMDAGTHRLVWNGRAPDSSALAAGRYQVVTRFNGKEVVRWVELQASSV